MKKTRLFILVGAMLCMAMVYSQQAVICGEIEYVQSTHFSRDFSRDFSLKFNTINSVYKEVVTGYKKEKIKQIDKKGLQLNREVPRNNLTPEFFYNNRKSFYFMEVFLDEELLVKEDFPAWQWRLTDGVKKIGGFNCQKATIEFRGREYTAWFTEEIPVPFGPWKFQGLSGLILEVYDKDGVFHIVTKKLKIGKQLECDIKIDKSKFESALTIEQYLKKKNELIKEDFAKLSSRLPKGFGPLKLDENCNDCREEIEIFKDE